jgi:cytoskeletal protein CcmA (bactofilin family)
MSTGCAKWLTLVAILAAAAAPQSAAASEPETLTRRLGDDLFMAGADLRLAEGIPGDALLAGGRIITSGSVRGDEVVAGGQLELGANVDGSLYAAGGRVRLGGKAARNARLAGGDVAVGPEADVQGGLSVGGGQVEIDGRVGKYLQVGAGRTRIDGHVAGDADVASGELSVGPAAVIDGALTYYGPQPAVVAPGAQIKGGLHYVERRHWSYGAHGGVRRGFGVGGWIWLIGWMIVGSILLTLWPGFARSVTDVALRRTWLTMLLGFIVLVCVPVAIVLSLITIIGIPLALLGICLYLLLFPLGYLAAAVAIGDSFLSRLRRGTEILTGQRVLMLLAVLVALFVLTRVPVLGGILRFLVILVGVGSLVMAVAARHRAPAAA